LLILQLLLEGYEKEQSVLLFELTFSRYADNCAFLSPRPLDFEKLKRQVQRFVKGHGLELSWEKTFADEPTLYLGTAIYKDIVNLDPEKLGFYYDVLYEAMQSPYPRTYLKQISGHFNWVKRITRSDRTNDELEKLYQTYEEYFAKAGNTPKNISQFFAKRQQYFLF